jgi:hypothetical protein
MPLPLNLPGPGPLQPFKRRDETAAAGNVVATPSTVVAVAAVPSPVVQAAAIATPGTVVAVAGVPSPTLASNQVATPGTVVAVAAVPAPTVRAAAVATPATVVAVAAVPAPTILAGAIATPATVIAVAAVPAPTVRAGAVATPATVVAVAAVPAPSVAASAIVQPSTVVAVATVPAPTISLAGDATASPATVVAIAAVPSPTVLAGAIATPATVVAVAAVPAPTVKAAAITTPATVVAIAAVPAPTVRGTAIATPATVVAIAAVPAPTILLAGDATATPATVVAVAAVPAPTVLAAARATPATVVAIAVVPAPTLRSDRIATPATVVAIATVPAPTIRANAIVTPATVIAVAAVGAPTIPSQFQVFLTEGDADAWVGMQSDDQIGAAIEGDNVHAFGVSLSVTAGLVGQYELGNMATLFQDAARTVPVTADGQPIGGVTDLSGAGHHLAQATAASRPTFKIGALNGQPVARFDGTDDSLSGQPFTSDQAAISVFVVAVRSSVAAVGPVIEWGFAGGFGMHLWNFDAGDKVYCNFGTGPVIGSAGVVSAGVPFRFGVTGAQGGIGRLYFNGSQVGADISPIGILTHDPMYLALRPSLAGPVNNWLGDQAAVLIYNRVLSSVELAQVDAFLFARYWQGSGGNPIEADDGKADSIEGGVLVGASLES